MLSADVWYRGLTSWHEGAAFLLGDSGFLAPYRAQFEITYRCNSFCRHCCKKHTPQGAKDLPPDGLNAADWIALAHSLPPYTLITITGGEPLLYPEFERLLDGIARRRVVNLLTNATLLTDELIDRILRRRVVLIGAPIYGTPERHDAFVRAPRHYEMAVENLRRLRARQRATGKRRPLLDLKVVVHEGNLDEVDHFVALATELDADFLTFSLAYDNPVMLSPFLKPDLSPPEFRQQHPFGPRDPAARREFAAVFSRLRQQRGSGRTRFRFYPPFPSAESAAQFFLSPADGPGCMRRCRGPWGNLVINPAGDVFPCLSVKVGSVRDSSWREIWRGAAFRDFRRAIRAAGTLPACWGCCYVAVDFPASSRSDHD
ncbi:MAG: radical SAM protein [Myxococcales bacterium]|nr:radical SAM protein [Myxococcales bacterium]